MLILVNCTEVDYFVTSSGLLLNHICLGFQKSPQVWKEHDWRELGFGSRWGDILWVRYLLNIFMILVWLLIVWIWISLVCSFWIRAEPHYGWADVVGDSTQLLSIQPLERPPGVFPNIDFSSSPPPNKDDPPGMPPSTPLEWIRLPAQRKFYLSRLQILPVREHSF